MDEAFVKKILEKKLSNSQQIDTIIKELSPSAQEAVRLIVKTVESTKQELPKNVIKMIGDLTGFKEDIQDKKNGQDTDLSLSALSENVSNIAKEIKIIKDSISIKDQKIEEKIEDKQNNFNVGSSFNLISFDELEREIDSLI